jgi:hypothetical protein
MISNYFGCIEKSFRLKELPPEPWEVTYILKCNKKLSFFEVIDYDDATQQFEQW